MPLYPLLPTPSPIDRLPVELISYIFSLSSDHTLFTQVNKRWRTIALSTSALWTNICITIRDLNGPLLHTNHITKYLTLSRKSPLNILIDARDPDWDFTETDVSTADIDDLDIDESNPYIHPFHSSHMDASFDLLLPHVTRWRSLTVLTDTWSPMHTTLFRLNSSLASTAPLLESLTLMRCNQFACYSPHFQPHNMKGPKFVPFGASSRSPFPRLRSLNLTGVHVDWSALASILPTPTTHDDHSSSSTGGLHSLELSYHANEVRPTVAEFRDILSACPHLESLIVKASGPLLPEDDDVEIDDNAARDDIGDHRPISLPRLDDLVLGYTSALNGCKILDILDAPNVKIFTLEDESHPANPIDEDAECLLTYLATGVIETNYHQPAVDPSPVTDKFATGTVTTEDNTPTNTLPSPLPTLTLRIPTPPPPPALTIPFPQLEDLTLTRVKACPSTFKTFFSALHRLQRLELEHTSTHVAHGLLPQQEGTYTTEIASSSCPCPELNDLDGRGAYVDLDFIVGGLVSRRNEGGASSEFGDVEIYWDGYGDDVECPRCCHGGGGVCADVVPVLGTDVKVFRRPCGLGASTGDDEERRYDPFVLGGTFNDPAFDEYHGQHGV